MLEGSTVKWTLSPFFEMTKSSNGSRADMKQNLVLFLNCVRYFISSFQIHYKLNKVEW